MYEYLSHIAQRMGFAHLSKEYLIRRIEESGFYIADIRDDKYLIKPIPGYNWEVVRKTGLPIEAMELLYYNPEKESFSSVCERMGTTRPTGYRWRKVLASHGYNHLELKEKNSVEEEVEVEINSEQENREYHYLYFILDKRTGATVYIGITDNPERRKGEHFNNKEGRDHIKPLYKLFAQQGVENYIMEVRAQDEDREFIEKMERQLITHTPGLYNVQYNR